MSGGYVLQNGSFACFVLDCGTYQTRAGYSIDVNPRHVVPSVALIKCSESSTQGGEEDMAQGTRRRTTTILRSGVESLSHYYVPFDAATQQCVRLEWVCQSPERVAAMAHHVVEKSFFDSHSEWALPAVIVPPRSCATRRNRGILLSALFELNASCLGGAGGVHIAKPDVCAAFATGLPSAVVLDLGYEQATVRAVVEGSSLPSSEVTVQEAGGQALSQACMQWLKNTRYAPDSSCTEVHRITRCFLPRALRRAWDEAWNTPPTNSEPRIGSPSLLLSGYAEYWTHVGIDCIKRQLIKISQQPIMAPVPNALWTVPEEAPNASGYQLPDGTRVIWSPLQSSVFLEPLFQSAFDVDVLQRTRHGPERRRHGIAPLVTVVSRGHASDVPLVKRTRGSSEEVVLRSPSCTTLPCAVHRCLLQVDAEVRAQLTSLVLCGGGSELRGILERMQQETSGLMDEVRIPPTAVHGVWSGAALLASVPTFQHRLVTRQMYEEEGVDRMVAHMGN